jgi:hypothetical protein
MKEYTVKIDIECTRRWYLNGKLHREDGPAVEYADGSKEWWINGQCHREDGPAVEYADGTTKEWWLSDVRFSEEDFKKEMVLKNLITLKHVVIDGKKYKLTLVLDND